MIELVNEKTGVVVRVSQETADLLGPEYQPAEKPKRATRQASTPTK